MGHRRYKSAVSLEGVGGDPVRGASQFDHDPQFGPHVVESGGENTDESSAEIEFQLVYDRALRLLAHREHSVQELMRKLGNNRAREKGAAESVCRAVVDNLIRLDLQSDARFAEVYARSRVGKGYGPVRIRQELRQRGIEDALIEDQLTRDAEYWTANAQRVRYKRFKGAGPESRNEWNAQARFLAQRGFPSDLIYRVLGEQD